MVCMLKSKAPPGPDICNSGINLMPDHGLNDIEENFFWKEKM